MFVLNHCTTDKKRRYQLRLGDTVVGRAETADICIDDTSVSRRHAQFSVAQGACTITDLASRNGTKVNGKGITQAALTDGDRVGLGDAEFVIEFVSEQLTLSDSHVIGGGPNTVVRPVTSLTHRGLAGKDGPNVRFLRLLSDVARMLLANSPPNQVFGQIVQLTFETFPAERSFLVLRDLATGALVPCIARSRAGTDILSVSLSRTIVNRVITERVSILSTDALKQNASESIRWQSIRSFMCAPLWNEGEVIGVLYTDAPRIERFTSADLDLFTILANLGAVAVEQSRLSAQVNEEVRRRERLERYHSANVVRRILEAEPDIDTSFVAQEREVSVLFADMVGFTRLSETLTSAQTASLLNGFFERMGDCIFQHEGTLDKFIGDAVMAVFGAPFDQPDHAARAVRTAHSMHQAMTAYNAERGDSAIHIRIGIHSGLVRAGDIGSRRRREYTVLGDVVNTASRLESSVAKPGQIIISSATRDRLGDGFPLRYLGSVAVRGRQEPIEVFDASLEPGDSSAA